MTILGHASEIFCLPCRLSIEMSTLQYLEDFFISSTVLFEDRIQRPSPFVPPAYLAVNACGG